MKKIILSFFLFCSLVSFGQQFSSGGISTATAIPTSSTFSTVLTNGNNAGGLYATNFQQIVNTVGGKQTLFFADAVSAAQMYMAGSNGNAHYNMQGIASTTTTPTINVSVYDVLSPTVYATGFQIAPQSFVISNAVGSTFPGMQYESTTSTLVRTNQTATSILDRAANDLRYAPIVVPAATHTTSVTTPLLVGGSTSTSKITYKTTTGTGTTGADHVFVSGTNGGTEIARFTNAGSLSVGVGTSPAARVDIALSSAVFQNIGLKSTISGASSQNTGITTSASGGGTAFGLQATAANGTINTYAVTAEASGSGTGVVYGVLGTASGGVTNYGANFTAIDNSATDNYGCSFSASDAVSTNLALNANVSGEGLYGIGLNITAACTDNGAVNTGIIISANGGSHNYAIIAPESDSSGFGVSLPQATVHVVGSFRVDGRTHTSQGANLTASNDLTLETNGNSFLVSGNTTINAITSTNWISGDIVRLIFSGTLTLKNETSGGAGTKQIWLAGDADMSVTPDDVVALMLESSCNCWREISRTVH